MSIQNLIHQRKGLGGRLFRGNFSNGTGALIVIGMIVVAFSLADLKTLIILIVATAIALELAFTMLCAPDCCGSVLIARQIFSECPAWAML